MTLTPRQRSILLGIAGDIQRYSKLKPREDPSDWNAYKERGRIEDAKDGIVQTNPAAWLGKPPSPGDYVMLSRDYKKLCALGLIEKLALGGDEKRTTHFLITDAGKDLAASFTQPINN